MRIFHKEFALSCGIAQNTMNYYLNGQRKPSYEAVSKILIAYPNLSAEWLTRGKEPMLISDSTINDQQTRRIDKLIGTIETMQESIELKEQTIAILKDRINELEAKLKSK